MSASSTPLAASSTPLVHRHTCDFLIHRGTTGFSQPLAFFLPASGFFRLTYYVFVYSSALCHCKTMFVFRMSRASLLARLPLYCSAECATPTNSSLYATFPRNLANAPPPPESFRTCFVCTTHAHSHFCPQHWLLCHLGLY